MQIIACTDHNYIRPFGRLFQEAKYESDSHFRLLVTPTKCEDYPMSKIYDFWKKESITFSAQTKPLGLRLTCLRCVRRSWPCIHELFLRLFVCKMNKVYCSIAYFHNVFNRSIQILAHLFMTRF